jgi:hypothetical protein
VGQFWTPITPESGSILHADSQLQVSIAGKSAGVIDGARLTVTIYATFD